MAFKTVDRYDDGENYTGFFNGPAFARKKLEERFDEMEKLVRGWSKDERINAGRNVVYSFVEFIDTKFNSPVYTPQQFVMTFIACATELGFAGLDPLPKAKMNEVAEILEVIGDKDAILDNDQFFDWKQFRDKDHQMLVDNFFGICPEPLLQEYPLWLLTYMLVVCCADKVNENGIKAVRKVWIDYLDVLDKRKRNPNYEYTGTYDRSHFRTSAEQGRVDVQQRQAEAHQKQAAEAAAKQAEEDRRNQLGELKNLHKGDTFLFGSYPQSGRSTSDRVEWVVLEQQASRILVISKKVLDDQAFHREKKTTPWCDSLIRTWLDATFLQKAFNDDERKLILPTAIHEPDNTGTVHSTTDRVFLLSETELRKYMPKPEDRKAEGTNVSNNQYWGLRSYQPGAESFRYVTAKGLIQSNKFGTDGFTYTNYDCTLGVRPAMWLETKGTAVDAYVKKEEEKMRLQEEVAAQKAEEIKKKETDWRADCTRIVERRLQAVDERVKTEHERQVADAKRRMEQEQNKVQDKLNEHHAKKSHAEQELETLKFYQFGRKKELREAIEYAAAQIEKRVQEKAEWETWFLEEQKNIESKLPAYREEIKKTVYQQNPIPKKPAATDKPKLFKSKNSALDLKAAIENMGMATKEELKAIGGYGYDKDLEALKTRGLVEAVAVRGEYYYLALSNQELRDLGGEVWESPEEIARRKEEEDRDIHKAEILNCLCRARYWMTCSDIQRMLNVELSTPRISALVNQMVGEGLVEKKTEKRVSYFRA